MEQKAIKNGFSAPTLPYHTLPHHTLPYHTPPYPTLKEAERSPPPNPAVANI